MKLGSWSDEASRRLVLLPQRPGHNKSREPKLLPTYCFCSPSLIGSRIQLQAWVLRLPTNCDQAPPLWWAIIPSSIFFFSFASLFPVPFPFPRGSWSRFLVLHNSSTGVPSNSSVALFHHRRRAPLLLMLQSPNCT